MKQKRKLFELGELMRKASIAAYDINRSIQKLAKENPEQASQFERDTIEGLLKQIREFQDCDQGSRCEAV